MTGIKHDQGKREYSLLLKEDLINDIVDVIDFGKKKYGSENWKELDNGYDRFLEACFRHIIAFNSGTILDSETKKSHLAHAIVSLIYAKWHFENNRVFI